MSKPVSNIEIEDVLSSIRRLVAEGEKPRGVVAGIPVNARPIVPAPRAKPSATPVATQIHNPPSARQSVPHLVLTPAFRVNDPVSRKAAADLVADVAKAVAQAAASKAKPDDLGPLLLTPQDAADFDAPAAHGQPKPGEPAPRHPPEVARASALFLQDIGLSAADDAFADVSFDYVAPEVSPENDLRDNDLRDNDLRDGDAQVDDTQADSVRDSDLGTENETGTDTAFTVSGTGEDTDTEAEFMVEAATFHSSRLSSSRLQDTDRVDHAPTGAPTTARPTSGRTSLEDTIAELEAAITHQPDDWEPDGSEGAPVIDWSSASTRAGLMAARRRGTPGTDIADAELVVPDPAEARSVDSAPEFESVSAEDLVPEDLAPEDLAPADVEVVDFVFPDDSTPEAPSVTAQAQDAGSASVETGFASALHGDDAVIDEAALRALVAEIVRDELQGKLGERITRNVRKLVRREIYRVISSEGFD